MHPIDSEPFAILRKNIESHARLDGYYIIKLVDIRDDRLAALSNNDLLDAIFQHFDNHAWPPIEQRPIDQSWSDYEVDREKAIAVTVQNLIAGRSRGHLKPTMRSDIARSYFDRFDAMFDHPKSYFVGLGIGDPVYVFMDGCAIVSEKRAGILWVVEDD